MDKPKPATSAPEHCTCQQCEARYKLNRLSAEQKRALAQWIVDGPAEQAEARATVKEIIGA